MTSWVRGLSHLLLISDEGREWTTGPINTCLVIDEFGLKPDSSKWRFLGDELGYIYVMKHLRNV